MELVLATPSPGNSGDSGDRCDMPMLPGSEGRRVSEVQKAEQNCEETPSSQSELLSLEAIASSLEAIALRLEAIALRLANGWPLVSVDCRAENLFFTRRMN